MPLYYQQFLSDSLVSDSILTMQQPILPFLLPNQDDDLNFHELSFKIRPPGLDMQPGDFRHITMRESYRSIVKAVWLATNATPDAWDQLAAFEYPAPLDMSLNALEDRRRFNELGRTILVHAPPYGDGEDGLAFMALTNVMLEIAKHGWQGYMERRIEAHAAAVAAGPFVPAPVPFLLPAN